MLLEKDPFQKDATGHHHVQMKLKAIHSLEQMDKIMGNPSKSSIKLVPGLMEKHLLCKDHISTLVLLYPAFLTNTWHLN